MNPIAGIVNRTTLAALLAIQLVVIGVLLAARSGGVEEPEPFLSFDAAAVDAMTVSNQDGSVTVTNVGGSWQLSDGVPAASLKVESVIEKIGEIGGSWPVADRQSTRERFEVTEDNHQRHVILRAGDETVADFFLGTSPGFRKTHARRTGDDEVYAVRFSNYEAGVKTADWLEKSLLRPKGELTAVTRIDTFELNRDDEGGWASAEGTELDPGKVETLVGRFKGLSVVDVSDATLPETPTATFALADDDGVQTLELYTLEDGEKFVATSDRVPGTYEVAKYIAEQMDKTLSDLVPDPPEDEESADGEAEEEMDDAVTDEPPAEAESAEEGDAEAPAAVEEATESDG